MLKSLAKAFSAYGAIMGGCKRAATALFLATAAMTSPAVAQQITILALGDSLTQGYGLPDGDGFVPQLQAWLQDRGHDAAVINAGVSGDTTAGGLSRVDWALTDEVDAMIVALGGNDLLRGIDPANSRQNLRGILATAQARGLPVLLIGLPAPGNYGPDYKRDFEAMYPDLSEEFATLLVRNMLAGIARPDAGEAVGSVQTDLMQDDRIHPNARGVKRIVADLGPTVERLIERAQKP